MKLVKKNLRPFLVFLFTGLLIGSLSWELLERLLAHRGIEVTMSVGPIGIDLSVVSFYVKINPGSFLGVLAGILLFKFL